VPIFNPFLMATLLVRKDYLMSVDLAEGYGTQIFKIVAPYVILSVIFARLNARLTLPPFSLFLIALTLTDGALRVHLG
jgi:GPI ethanolamine phosphate transferase 1